MWFFIRSVLIFLFTAGLTLLVVDSSDMLHLFALIVLSALSTVNLIVSDSPAVLRRTLISLLLGALLVWVLFGTGHGLVGWPDPAVLIITALLTLILVDALNSRDPPVLEILALVAALSLTLLWHFYGGAPSQPLPVTERPFNALDRMVQAIGGNNQVQAKREIEARFGVSSSDAWRNRLGAQILQSGPWPLTIFFTEFTDRGAALANGLWGKPVDTLQFSDSPGSLQPLLGCRNAIRSLFGKDAQYTPFFQAEDFGGSNNPLGSLVDKVHKHRAVMTTREGCDSKPKVLVTWIGGCFEPLDAVKKELIDEDLKHIKAVETACQLSM
jgi:hypothetical protein